MPKGHTHNKTFNNFRNVVKLAKTAIIRPEQGVYKKKKLKKKILKKNS